MQFLYFKHIFLCTFHASYNMLIVAFILLSLASVYSCSAQIVNNHDRTVYGWIGESVSMRCASRDYIVYPIYWYHQDSHNYLSTDNIIYDNLPSERQDRLSVECNRSDYSPYATTCLLTIDHLTDHDAGTYICLYYHELNHTYMYNFVNTIRLAVYPPSNNSLICYASKTGTYVPYNTYEIGDEIYLHCSVEDSSTNPLLNWTRTTRSNITTLISYHRGTGLVEKLLLTEQDVGAIFTCFMSHPALPDVRSCLLTPLPIIDQPSTPTSKPRPRSVTRFLVSSTMKSNDKKTTQHFFLFIAMAVVFVVAMIIFIRLWMTRKNNPTVLSDQSRDRNEGDHRIQPDIEGELNAPNYTELNVSEIKNRRYQGLETLPMNSPNIVDDAFNSSNFEDEETALDHDCYEIVAVSDHSERKPYEETNQDPGVVPPTYKNLQRPVKALNFSN